MSARSEALLTSASDGIYEDEWTTLISDRKDLELDDSGLVKRDLTVASRCRARLTCRRGEYLFDPTMGSRLHTIRTIRQAEQEASAMVEEALEPLIQEGAILGSEITAFEADHIYGIVALSVQIQVDGESAIDLGLIKTG